MLEGNRKAATEAHQQTASAVRRMGAERAAALVRPAPKRYKNFRNRGKLIPIKQLLKKLHQKEQDGKVNQLMKIHFVKTVEDKSAGIEEVCAAAKDTHMKNNAGSAYGEAPGERVEISEDYGELEFVAPSNELEAQREMIQNLKNAKWITITSSPFAAPAMMVGKKEDGPGKQQYRMVINYQELNAITISPEYPLPRIQDILDLLHGAKVFSTMDMEQGFHQIRMAPEDQHKTAFRTCMGQYEFKGSYRLSG
ncbi:OSJNBa0020J04.2 protein, related [Eimeria brunetti]|uniref:OSJNBa0020J04.2 protein, related n=1 Tax=Eimeria brunetti TaxID=51314 RepID=U6LQ09_9EIME|nr:OSJNBa0020J04.2 protein, related [Eimeria brunetti]